MIAISCVDLLCTNISVYSYSVFHTPFAGQNHLFQHFNIKTPKRTLHLSNPNQKFDILEVIGRHYVVPMSKRFTLQNDSKKKIGILGNKFCKFVKWTVYIDLSILT